MSDAGHRYCECVGCVKGQRERLHDEYVMAALTGLTQKLSPSDWVNSAMISSALEGLVVTARAIADEAMRQREG